MSTLQTPGVYVFEVPPASSPITGVGTSTAAFLGIANIQDTAMPETPASPLVFNTGTITYTQAPTPTVTLTGASWPDMPRIGEVTLTINNHSYPVASRQSATVLTLLSDAGKNPGSVLPALTKFTMTLPLRYTQAAAGIPQLVTNWGEFKQYFGDFTAPTTGTTAAPGNIFLAHAVYGFFNN